MTLFARIPRGMAEVRVGLAGYRYYGLLANCHRADKLQARTGTRFVSLEGLSAT
jgi:hypothetical protein